MLLRFFLNLRYELGLYGSLAAITSASLITHATLKKSEPLVDFWIILGIIMIPTVLSLLLSPHFTTILAALIVTYITYFVSLLISVVVYRVSPFHPLAKYPGPFIARITKFWDVYIVLTGRRHLYYQHMHERYGDYIRVGPNEISIRDVSVIIPLLGPQGLPKGKYYESRQRINTPPDLLSATGAEHARRRKPWNRAFSTMALKNYEELIQNRSMQLRGILEDRCGSILDLSSWFDLFVFDFVGDFIFGGAFEMMKDGGDTEHILEMLGNTMRILAWSGNVPWLKKLVLFFFKNDRCKFQESAIGRVSRRLEKGSKVKDLFHYLMGEDGGVDILTVRETVMEGGLAMVAGTDTTSYILSNLFYYLISDPEIMTRIQEEISQNFPDGELPFDVMRLAHMRLLNAVLDETMRLQPPILSGSQRKVPKGSGGIMLSGNYIAEDTNLFLPTYVLQRDPRYFSPAPESFWPDRWLPENERRASPPIKGPFTYIHDISAYIPFSYGPTSCVGKNLALQEMRVVTALLLQRFNFKFAQEYDPKKWEVALKDFYVPLRGNLPVTLEIR